MNRFIETKSAAGESTKNLNDTSFALQKLKNRVQYRPLRSALKIELEKKLFGLLAGRNISLEAVKSLIEEGVDINCVNQEGMTPLHQLTKDSNEKESVKDIVLLLIDHCHESQHVFL